MAGSRPDSEVDRETRDELWQTIGRILERYQPQECRNFFNQRQLCNLHALIREMINCLRLRDLEFEARTNDGTNANMIPERRARVQSAAGVIPASPR